MSIFEDVNKLLDTDGNFDQLTLGEVVDTNDPQQMGRVRVACPYFGDIEETVIEDLPWATPISPLAGSTQTASRGRGDDKTHGPVAYGMFNVPKVGAYVLVGCIEGDPRFRIYLGCIHDQFLPHALPHGRYVYPVEGLYDDSPSGPFSTSENFIQPLYSSQESAFQKKTRHVVVDPSTPTDPRKNFEFRTRGADGGVAGG